MALQGRGVSPLAARAARIHAFGVGTKIDVYAGHRAEYAGSREPTLVDVKPGRYLVVEGTGDPNGEEFRRKAGALYGAAYAIKFARKKAGQDFKAGALEGLWWANGDGAPFSAPRADWRWKLLLRVPQFVTAADVRRAAGELRAKGRPVAEVCVETLREGRCVQALHVGPYGDEPHTLARLDEFARQRGLRYRGAHHEIYLSDPRRVPASKIRTILRHPVVSAR